MPDLAAKAATTECRRPPEAGFKPKTVPNKLAPYETQSRAALGLVGEHLFLHSGAGATECRTACLLRDK